MVQVESRIFTAGRQKGINLNVSATVKPLQVGICVISMPETRYAGDLIEHRLKYMTDFLFGLGDLGRTNLFQDRPYRFASGGAALPNGWELLFGEAISGESPPRAPQSQEENGSCFGSETLSQNGMDYSGTGSAREAGDSTANPGARLSANQ